MKHFITQTPLYTPWYVVPPDLELRPAELMLLTHVNGIGPVSLSSIRATCAIAKVYADVHDADGIYLGRITPYGTVEPCPKPDPKGPHA